MINKTLYSIDMYLKDIQRIGEYIKENNIDHIVCVYRGSLPMGVHLSNIHDLPLSIVKYQTYDNKDKVVSFTHDADLQSSKSYLLLDDIYDTGHTIQTIQLQLKQFKGKMNTLCVYGKDNLHNVDWVHLHDGSWVEFWWEL